MLFHIFLIVFNLKATWYLVFASYNVIFTWDWIVALFQVFFNCFYLPYPFASILFILTVHIKAFYALMNLHGHCNFKETVTNGALPFPFSGWFFNAWLTKCITTTSSFIRVSAYDMAYFAYKHVNYLIFLHKSVMITTWTDFRHHLQINTYSYSLAYLNTLSGT